MKTKRHAACLLLVVALLLLCSARGQAQQPASTATKEANAALLKELPFDNKQSFEDAQRGLIAPLPKQVIKSAAGDTVWDPNKYAFVTLDAAAPDTVNPSLWRQSQLVNISGLFKVADRIYQIRNQDLSNMTIIEGDTGIIVCDPLISMEAAKAGMELYFAHRPKKSVVAIVHSHCHVDHFGGVRGVVDEADVTSGKVKIYAPVGFIEKAISENVMAGPAMLRRAEYMYGNLLPPSATGQVGSGLGTTVSTGTVTLLTPTDIISETGQEEKIDGLTFTFLWAPTSEAPTEMHWYISELRALTTAENATHTLHNTYSLRGTKLRDPLAWSKYLNSSLHDWGTKSDVLYGMHHWPVWGTDNVIQHLKNQRDMYRYINDETLRLANHGYTMVEIAEQVQLPKSLDTYWSNRGYYGTMNHNVKSTYVLHLGWFNGNPATLHPLPPVEGSKKYVEFMGGADAVLQKAQASYEAGDYRWVAEVVNHVVFADPSNQKARELQANALEQLGYQSESGPWRNFYLTGAQELRQGVMKLPPRDLANPDTIRVMTLDMFFDYLSMRIDHPKAADKQLTLNFDFTDTKEQYYVELGNGVLNHTAGLQSPDADSTITLTRETLNALILKEISLARAVLEEKIKIRGHLLKLEELFGLLDKFEGQFNIVTPRQ